MAEHESEAQKYLTKMTLKNQNDEKKTVTMIQDVISMDSAPINMDSVLASESVMFIHYKTMSGFMKLSKETKEGKDIFIIVSFNFTVIEIRSNHSSLGQLNLFVSLTSFFLIPLCCIVILWMLEMV